MDKLPRELLDQTFLYLLEYEYVPTERFPTLTPASKRGVLSVRQVWGVWRDEYPLSDLFVSVLEEKPFMIYGSARKLLHAPRLRQLAESPYAQYLTKLSLIVRQVDPEGDYEEDPVTWYRWIASFVEPLATLLAPFRAVRELRYYTTPNGRVPVEPARDDACVRLHAYHQLNSHLTVPQQQQAGQLLSFILRAFLQAKIALEAVTMPLFGNRASIHSLIPNSDLYIHAENMTRLSLNITIWHNGQIPIFGMWLFRLRNLEFIDIAVTRPIGELRSSTPGLIRDPILGAGAGLGMVPPVLPRVREFRFMSDATLMFHESNILGAARDFPALKKLCLAHLHVRPGSWSSLVRRLRELHLECLWLLNPTDVTSTLIRGDDGGENTSTTYSRFRGIAGVQDAAQKIRLIHTVGPWGVVSKPLRRCEFDYPGFSLFEGNRQVLGDGVIVNSLEVIETRGQL